MPNDAGTTVLSAKPLGFIAYLRQLWQYRQLTLLLARRDIKIKYAQSVVGIFWSLLQPLTGLLIFTLFFDRVIHIQTTTPYPLFAFTGIVCWQFFSTIVATAGTSLMESQHIIKKVYFPKMSLLFAKVLIGMLELSIAVGLLLLMMLVLGSRPGIQVLFFPVVVLMIIAVGLSVAIWLSALTIRYRDFYHIIPYLLNYGIWLTPVFYPGTILPAQYAWILFINPMAACIAWMRWVLLGDPLPDVHYLISFVPVAVLLITGLSYFRTIENRISDYI
jgi:lipopolysaccharide transport system permease protein